jgi:hypothetical protein
MSKYIELAKKMKALAEKGVGGEKLNAQRMLEMLLKKHNLSISDIEGEEINEYFFNLKTGESQLWQQIVKSVNPEIKCYGKFLSLDIKRYQIPGNYSIKCTLSEYIEIEAKLSVYQRLYKEEVNIFYHAFCTANNLLIKPKEQITTDDLTTEELETFHRVRQMSKNIKSEQFRKQIGELYKKHNGDSF